MQDMSHDHRHELIQAGHPVEGAPDWFLPMEQCLEQLSEHLLGVLLAAKQKAAAHSARFTG